MTVSTPPCDESLLRNGVANGIITHDQATRLLALAAETAEQPPTPQDDEKLRFITGFNDIFVTIGIALFLGAMMFIPFSALSAAMTQAMTAVMAWLLAEYFTRRRRLALPSIVLVTVFVACVYAASLFALSGVNSPSKVDSPIPFIAAGLIALTAAVLHYWRFRVPITVAAGAAAVGASVLALFGSIAPQFTEIYLQPLLAILGVAVFALAMAFDLKDPHRVSLNNDIAFWLHLLAAPLIVHPLISSISNYGYDMSTGSAVAVLGTFLALAFVALVVDRRAMLVSGLVYAGVAFSQLIGLSGDAGWPITMLALGTFVLALSAGWRPLRGALLACFPLGLRSRLPHPSTSG